MIDWNPHSDYEDNRDAHPCGDNEEPCAMCGKPIRTALARHWVHIHNDGLSIVTEEEATELPAAADFGIFPVGADCWKSHFEIHAYGLKNQN